MRVEVPLKFWKGGQARTFRGMCTMLAFPFTWCPAGLGGEHKGQWEAVLDLGWCSWWQQM